MDCNTYMLIFVRETTDIKYSLYYCLEDARMQMLNELKRYGNLTDDDIAEAEYGENWAFGEYSAYVMDGDNSDNYAWKIIDCSELQNIKEN